MKDEAALHLLTSEVRTQQVGNRTDQAALLAWFLESVWRLDPEAVPDVLCDGPQDKGIDALYVDDDQGEIVVFQSKWRQDPAKSTQGDAELKAFVGVAGYFQTIDAFDALMDSRPNPELRKLLIRQGVRDKIGDPGYTVSLVFVTNGSLDAAGDSYVASRAGLTPRLVIHEGESLAEVAEVTQRPALRPETVNLAVMQDPLVAKLTPTETMAVALVRAKELVKLPGIADATLFSQNVRLAIGRSAVNLELRNTVNNAEEHRLFPAFHNGLTLLTEHLEIRDGSVVLKGVGVVNGCQSLTTLYNNASSITDGLALLLKVVQVPARSDVADRITTRSNSQNSVTLRDQRSNDKATRFLQHDVQSTLAGRLFLKVKNGEPEPAGVPVLDNTFAAQLIVAFYLEEPWNAVRKLRLFDEDFRRIFSKNMTAYKLLLLVLANQAVEEARSELRSDLAASFAAIRFTLIYLVERVLRLSAVGEQLRDDPARWLGSSEITNEVTDALQRIALEVVYGVNDYVEQRTEDDTDFDPKVAFKSQSGVTGARQVIERDAKREERRGRAYLFSVSPAAQ